MFKFNLATIIKLGASKLTEYLQENGNKITLTVNEINDWSKNNNLPFRVLCLDDEEKGKVIQIFSE